MRMKKKLFIEALCLVLAAGALVSLYNSYQSDESDLTIRASYNFDALNSTKVQSHRVNIYDPERAFKGYTLIPVEGSARIKLVDMFGM